MYGINSNFLCKTFTYISAAFPTSGTGQVRRKKKFLEQSKRKNRFAIFAF
jgi:hypothetical protein